MKRYFAFYTTIIILIILLSACSPDSNGTCEEGICISFVIDGPVKAMEPARFTIVVQTEKDISELGVTLDNYHSISIADVENIPETANLAYQDKNMMGWLLDTKGGVEYVFSGHVVFAKPTVSYGIFSYSLFASASYPSLARVTDSVTIYLDAEGNQVENDKAILELQTDWPAPTPPPDLTVVPPTPWPTIVWPTETPFPTATPAGYPAPVIEGNAIDGPISPTLAAYPNP